MPDQIESHDVAVRAPSRPGKTPGVTFSACRATAVNKDNPGPTFPQSRPATGSPPETRPGPPAPAPAPPCPAGPSGVLHFVLRQPRQIIAQKQGQILQLALHRPGHFARQPPQARGRELPPLPFAQFEAQLLREPRQPFARPENAQLLFPPRQQRPQRHRPPLLGEQLVRPPPQLLHHKLRQALEGQNPQPRVTAPNLLRSKAAAPIETSPASAREKSAARPPDRPATRAAPRQDRQTSSRPRLVPKEIALARVNLSRGGGKGQSANLGRALTRNVPVVA